MKKYKILIISLVSFFILFSLSGCQNTSKNLSSKETKNTKQQKNNKNEITKKPPIKTFSQEEKNKEIMASTLFSNYMNTFETTKNQNQIIKEFVVQKIKINESNQNGFIFEVSYDVRPLDINNTSWSSGNGEVQGEWVTGKTQFVTIQDGIITNMTTEPSSLPLSQTTESDKANTSPQPSTTNNETSQDSLKNTAKNLFTDYLETHYVNTNVESDKILNFTVNDIKILKTNDTGFDFQVAFDVQPKSDLKGWAGGNGTIEGDWVKGKVLQVRVEDGKITEVGTGLY